MSAPRRPKALASAPRQELRQTTIVVGDANDKLNQAPRRKPGRPKGSKNSVKKKGLPISQDELGALTRLRELLSGHLEAAVITLVSCTEPQNPAATRERAAARLLEIYRDVSARVPSEPRHTHNTLIVDPETLALAAARARAAHQATLAAAKPDEEADR